MNFFEVPLIKLMHRNYNLIALDHEHHCKLRALSHSFIHLIFVSFFIFYFFFEGNLIPVSDFSTMPNVSFSQCI